MHSQSYQLVYLVWYSAIAVREHISVEVDFEGRHIGDAQHLVIGTDVDLFQNQRKESTNTVAAQVDTLSSLLQEKQRKLIVAEAAYRAAQAELAELQEQLLEATRLQQNLQQDRRTIQVNDSSIQLLSLENRTRPSQSLDQHGEPPMKEKASRMPAGKSAASKKAAETVVMPKEMQPLDQALALLYGDGRAPLGVALTMLVQRVQWRESDYALIEDLLWGSEGLMIDAMRVAAIAAERFRRVPNFTVEGLAEQLFSDYLQLFMMLKGKKSKSATNLLVARNWLGQIKLVEYKSG